MQQKLMINPDEVCRQAVQAKIVIYQAKEQFECVLKQLNDQVDRMVNLIEFMKRRILDMEAEEQKRNEASDVSETVEG